MSDLEREKALAAARAVGEVRDGMLVGLGTGSTAAYAVRLLAERVASGLRIIGVATSKQTEALARSLGLSLRALEEVRRVDLAIDGADELAPDLSAIKGGGGALLREKIVAAAADRTILVLDSSKPVEKLGRFPLPVEVLPAAAGCVSRSLEELGLSATRRVRDHQPFLTDQGCHIYDIACGAIDDPARLAARLDGIPGLIEHGLFINEITMAIIARGDAVEIRARTPQGACK